MKMSVQHFLKIISASSLLKNSSTCLKTSLEFVRNYSKAEAGSLKKVPTKRADRHVTNEACAQSICHHLPKNCEYVLEGTPGAGVLTEALLKSNEKLKVRVFEPNQESNKKLKDLQKIYDENRLKLVRTSFWNLSSYLYKDRVHGTSHIYEIFEGIKPRSWNEGPPFVMLGTIPTSLERTFVATLPPILCERTAMFAFGRAQFIVYVSHHTYKIMTATSKDSFQIYLKMSVLFSLLFDVELLAKESLDSFSSMGRTDQTKPVRKKFDENHLYLMRITPKAELGFNLAENVSLKEFLYFVQQTFSNRTAFVIDKIDSFIPRVGPRLIKLGYTTTTRFGELSPIDVAHLFREFSSWPEYEHSNFKSVAGSAQEHFDSTAGNTD